MNKELENDPFEHFHFLFAAAVIKGACPHLCARPEDPQNQHHGPHHSFLLQLPNWVLFCLLPVPTAV